MEAMWKALATAGATSSGLRIWQVHLSIGPVMPTTSVSWKASVPREALPTWPAITMTGVESTIASATPVMTLVAPGPEVTITTPGFPVARA